MFVFNGKAYILVPLNLTKSDTEFNIYNESGKCIGTTVEGIREGKVAENEREAIENFLLDASIKLEAELKFTKEFSIPAAQANDLSICTDEIVSIMESNWSISASTMDQLLDSYGI